MAEHTETVADDEILTTPVRGETRGELSDADQDDTDTDTDTDANDADTDDTDDSDTEDQ